MSMCGEGFRETHHSLQGQRQSCDVIYLPESEILLLGSPFLSPAAVCVCVCLWTCMRVHACVLMCVVYVMCVVGTGSRVFRTWEAAWFRVELANWAS